MTRDAQDAINAGIPIFIGYVPAAIAFGILSKGCNITLLESFLFSAVVFAGASQFIALNMLMTGMGPGGIILTTLLVNFRHFLMSACLSTRLSKMAKKNIFFMAFGITDEVFSVLSFKKGELSAKFVFILQWSAYSGWVAGTVAGYVLGGFLPEILIKSMGVALYALLLAILLPEIRQSVKALILTLASGVLNTLLIKLDILPNGWNIIVCILVIALAGSFLISGEIKEEAYDG
ncbi:MAG: branched-chain amino acid transport protein AzlC [Desulfobacula sp. RIFOXYB2_FULL_45_6]|nr:MAG: branched-chain amino acid transport protein AzlC [Desulfobacula sp. RIFOXYB2_FULL_45_6]